MTTSPILPSEKATLLRDRLATFAGTSKEQDGYTLFLDAAPALITNADGAIVGIDAMVRLFQNGNELPVDPHRICINPPLQVVTAPARYNQSGEMTRDRAVRLDPEAAYWEWLWANVLEVSNPKGWRTKGTVTTVFSDASDGSITSSSTTYSTARAGSSLTPSTTSAAETVGQNRAASTRFCFEGFVSFDTSSIPDTDTVSDAVLSIYGAGDSSTTDFTMNARTSNWGATLTTGDWVAGASLSGLTLLATYSTASGWSAVAYNDFSSGVNMPAAIDKAGITYILLSSSRHEAGNDPAGNEFVNWYAAEQAGTTQDPKLTVTHAVPATVKNLALLGVG